MEAEHKDSKEHKKHEIELEFITTAGDLKAEFPANERLGAVKKEVMTRLHLDPAHAADYVVLFEGRDLDENKTLAELGLKSGDELFIERKEIVKV